MDELVVTSILLPSRGRPTNVTRLRNSVATTTEDSWEIIVRLDDDDPAEYPSLDGVRYLTGPRNVLSDLWNDCWRASSGDVLMHCGDDIVFRTPGWDRMVANAFPPDGIAFVHGDDLGGKGGDLGTHGFLRREWVDAVGIFAPPYYVSDYTDLHFNVVADAIGRRVFLPDVVTEHMHPAFDKAEWDQTFQDRLERHKAGNPEAVWAATADERAEWATKLRAVMR